MNCGIVYKEFMLLLLYMSVKGCMLTCLKLQQFWRQKKDGQIFEWFVDIVHKTEFIYIPNFKMVYLITYKYMYILNLYVVDYFVVYNFCKVFHFAHLIS
jgi:hypothetical protein